MTRTEGTVRGRKRSQQVTEPLRATEIYRNTNGGRIVQSLFTVIKRRASSLRLIEYSKMC